MHNLITNVYNIKHKLYLSTSGTIKQTSARKISICLFHLRLLSQSKPFTQKCNKQSTSVGGVCTCGVDKFFKRDDTTWRCYRSPATKTFFLQGYFTYARILILITIDITLETPAITKFISYTGNFLTLVPIHSWYMYNGTLLLWRVRQG